MEFYLTNVPGSQYGADKTAIANQMANNNAELVLLNGSDTGTPAVNGGQPLYQTENVVEGSTAYINNDYDNHRDAAFEEILHMVHDTGIGVDGANTLPGVLKTTYQKEIRRATNNAKPTWDSGKGLWAQNSTNWYNELKAENSLTQEYLASVIDSYYGYWGAWTGGTGGMWGMYVAKTRDEIKTKDPEGWKLVDPSNLKFFSPWITYTARIDPTFNDTFSLAFNAAQPYTHKSQYLLNAQLLGNLHSGLTGNDQNNRLTGNNGNNTLTGGKGNDVLVGGAGIDTAKFSGNLSDYTINTDANSGVTTITDKVSGRDGTDKLSEIEMVEFKDQTINLL
ncbi:MAG: hypothetical protein CR991_09155 [Proteobacteria bacterium]|nr:MAG: hypothetical protein CR991_09155 [Pseudomonadota bacterium]